MGINDFGEGIFEKIIRMKPWLLFFKMTLIVICCKAQVKEENIYIDTVQIGQIPGLNNFLEFTELDKRMEKGLKENNLPKEAAAFKNNRSRIFIYSYTNGKPDRQDTSLNKGVPIPCESEINRDTLKIKMAIGLFGGIGVEINIYSNHFQSNYFVYTDDVKPFKYNTSDAAFTDMVYLKSKFQKLILNEKPAFKEGQQLTGYLTFTSPTFFEKDAGNSTNSSYVTGKLYFTCKTQ